MQEEIFGPILPVIPVKDMEAARAFVKRRPHPLACYVLRNEQKDRADVYEGNGVWRRLHQ